MSHFEDFLFFIVILIHVAIVGMMLFYRIELEPWQIIALTQ